MDHSSAAIGLEENKITAAIEPESPSSSSSSSSPVPAIKLKRKCSSGWTLSNNGTHSASAAGTLTTIYIPLYLHVVYFCICYCSIQEEWWNTQVAMILYINTLDFLKSAPICWLFDLLAVLILFISMSPSFQVVRYSISQKVHLYSPISPCLVTVTSDVCVRAAVVFLLYFR